MQLAGSITFESSLPLTVRPILPEGQGMLKSEINGKWHSQNSGGCSNHASYSANPAYQLKLSVDSEVIIRLKITSQ